MLNLGNNALTIARWVALVLAAITATAFLTLQGQQADITYGKGPSGSSTPKSATEEGSATLPPRDDVLALLDADIIANVTTEPLPFDEQQVREALAGSATKLVVLPAGVTDDQRMELDLPEPVVVVQGFQVFLSPWEIAASEISEMERVFGARDVTDLVLSLIAHHAKQPTPKAGPGITWRTPTADELAAVQADLAGDSIAFTGSTAAFPMPDAASEAFADGIKPLVVISDPTDINEPVPDYATALAQAHPDRPVVTVTGLWVTTAGQQNDEFGDAVRASYYSQFGRILSTKAITQDMVLTSYLNRIAEFRYSGMFDRPLPYVPIDPVKYLLPALPWVFAALALLYVVLTVREVGRPDTTAPVAATPDRHAELVQLDETAVRLSTLPDARRNAHLSRGLLLLRQAHETAEQDGPDRDVASLMTRAATSLQKAADKLGFTMLGPEDSKNGGSS